MIRLSGASKNLLEETGAFKEKESIKYARYGRLVLIPAILGGMAGGYAISTIFDNTYLVWLFGLLWFLIILAVDMAMAATLYRSKNTNSAGFWISVAFRIIFSVCVGVVISHPLVLRVFEPSIVKNLKERDTDQKSQNIFDAKAKVVTASSGYDQKITDLTGLNQCLSKLIQFERSKDNTFAKEFFVNGDAQKSCGFSSGYGAGCSSECIDRGKIITANKKEIAKLEKEKTTAINPEKTILQQAEDNRATNTTLDYLARTEALEFLANGDGKKYKEHPHISAATTALIWFFIVLDCLVVIFKAFTPMGAYEHTLDELLNRHIDKMQIETDAHKALSQGIAKANAKIETKKEEMLSVARLVESCMNEIKKQRDTFKRTKKATLASVGLFNWKKRKVVKQQLDDMEDLLDVVASKTIEKMANEIGT